MRTLTVNLTAELKDKLALMSKIYLSNKHSEAFPQAVKLDPKGMLHAINHLVSLSYKLGVDEVGLTPELPDEAFLLPDSAIKLLLSLSAGTEVTVGVENHIVSVSFRGGRRKTTAKFAELDVDSFPPIQAVDKGSMSISQVDKDFLTTALKSCGFAISNNPARGVYMGLNFIADGNKLTCFACDGYKSAVYSTEFFGNRFTITVPRDTIGIMQSCIKSSAEKVAIGVNGSGTKAIFALDSNTVLRTTLLSGELMDFKPLFAPKAHAFDIDANELCASLKKMLIVIGNSSANQPPTVVFDIEKDVLNISTHEGIASYDDSFYIKHTSFGEPVRIGFNVGYMQECIKAIDSDTVRIAYDSSLKPALIAATDSDNPQTLIIPVRIAGENS